MKAGLRYLLPSEVLLLVLLLPESPPALLLEELPEDFSELPELAGALEPALPPLLSLLAEAEAELPSDFVEDEEAGAEPLRA
jgi:hypothetical protein